MDYISHLFFSAMIVLVICSHHREKAEKNLPAGIEFNKETLRRICLDGDNWCITWSEDNSQITSLCEGIWIKFDYPEEGYFQNHLYRLTDKADNFQIEDIANYPVLRFDHGSPFSYGNISVDGTLYSTISKTPEDGWSGPFREIKLLKTTDNGETWYRIGKFGNELLLEGAMDSMRNVVNETEMFFLEEYRLPRCDQMAWPFSFVTFVQNGQNNSAAKDEYLHI